MSHSPRLSIVIPVRDEADNIAPLAARIEAALTGTGLLREVIWVDDGSGDATPQRLLELAAPHRWVRLTENCGQSAALMAGFLTARGTWIGTLDGDGQNDPADLLHQYEHALSQGHDMVNGIRVQRQDGWLRRLSAQVANVVRNRLTGESVTDVGCSTRVLRREAAISVPYFDGMHRFLPTLVRMRGFGVAEVPVAHRRRMSGRSKYGIGNRLLVGLHDLIGVHWLVSRQRVWTVVTPEELPMIVGPDSETVRPPVGVTVE